MAITKIQRETFNQLFKAAEKGQLMLGDFEVKGCPGKTVPAICIGWEVGPGFYEVVPVAALLDSGEASQLVPPDDAVLAPEVI